jgi:hypothetical protein
MRRAARLAQPLESPVLRLHGREVSKYRAPRSKAGRTAALVTYSDGVGIDAIRKTMTMLQGVLQRAVEWGRVRTNAVKLTRKRRSRTARLCRRSRRR